MRAAAVTMAHEERKKGRSRRNLAVDVPASREGHKLAEDSYNIEGGVFIKDNIAINATGVFMKDNPKAFTVRRLPPRRVAAACAARVGRTPRSRAFNALVCVRLWLPARLRHLAARTRAPMTVLAGRA